jgi:hypothetical protein
MKKIILMLVVLSTFSNCMVIGPIVGGKKTTSEKEYTLNSKGSINKNKEALKEVLYQQGYMKLSETENTLQFELKGALISELIFSKVNAVLITADVFEDKIKLEIVQNGNFKKGKSEKVEKTFLKIKNEFEKIK